MRVLEIGCGRGVGTEIIFERFGAREVHAFDLDPDMIDQARARVAGYSPQRLKLFVGDAAAIDAEDDTYDAGLRLWDHPPRSAVATSGL